MQTITFYSYKGGTGRSLVVANAAKFLNRFGQRVFALDFDLEAPGLHYKFGLTGPNGSAQIKRGVVDYLYSFVTEDESPASIRDYVIELKPADDPPPLWLMPAGNAPCAQYWRQLARLSWHELFYSEDAKGVPLFLELKERIEHEFAPDFLLIDSRTGITEIGGVATSVLADTVVCLLINNRENLEGVREVLRSIRRSPRLPGQSPARLLTALTRIPITEKPDTERRILRLAQDFLQEEAPNLSDTLEVPEILVLHSEPDLEFAEALRVGGEKSLDESPLYRDYTRLFSRLIPREVVDPFIAPLVANAVSRAFADPEGTQQQLEALNSSYPHPDVLRALLQLYRLRRVGNEAILEAGWRYWNITGKADEPTLWTAVQESVKALQPGEDLPLPPEFAEAVWKEAGATDIQVGLAISAAYKGFAQPLKAAEVLRGLLEKTGPQERVVVAYISRLKDAKRFEEGFDIVQAYKALFEKSPLFQTARASLLLAKGDSAEVARLLETGELNLDGVSEANVRTFARLLIMAGKSELIDPKLEDLLNKLIARGPSKRLEALGAVYKDLGRFQDFEARMYQVYPEEVAKELLDRVRPKALVHYARQFRGKGTETN